MGEANFIQKPSKMWFPKTVEEAWAIKKKYNKEASYIAGGTFLQLQQEKGTVLPPHLISLKKIPELQSIDLCQAQEKSVVIGSNVTLNNLLKSPLLLPYQSSMMKTILQIAAPAIRNLATIGGNLAHGFGDLFPSLLTMDAQITWFNGIDKQTKPLADFIHYKQVDPAAFENILIMRVLLPEYSGYSDENYYFEKLGRRESFIPAIVSVAAMLELDSNHVVHSARLALSGSNHLPKRLFQTEQVLLGKEVTTELLQKVYQSILQEYQPIDELLVNSNYKTKVAANMFCSEIVSRITKGKEGERDASSF
ncbi:FAD binding domain-containing protein [Alkalihalobacillus sp. 1P02AB]|uniref:FAD binding domain-containing protein n=1 Tax=Alkalihalobacillus sp. 1P02AB TaxID=3132260 RepID=UPI0039A72416